MIRLVTLSLLLLTSCSGHRITDDGIIGEGVRGKSASEINALINKGELGQSKARIEYQVEDPRAEGWFIYMKEGLDGKERYRASKLIEGGIYAK